ncbi:KEOPS complex subunit Pcc1 [Saccharolobus sp. A20]|uniref:KEOPS complex subunit Pcc1 n=1 Tax=Saccharolobus sp. A20 TaxID=1891280 RepID=UPI000AB1C97B|nr:KEOPS complex subunit Pcc1 [Sulfolobus sp. A20]
MKIRYKKPEVIVNSLNVDNIDLPKGMEIESRVIGNDEIEIIIKMKIVNANDILTLRNTVDEILLHVKAIQASLNAVS